MNNARQNHSLEPRRVTLEQEWNPQETVQPYDPYWANQQYLPPQYITIETPPPQQNAMTPMGMFTRSLENILQMQMTMFQEMDRRMHRLETRQPAMRAQSNEHFYAQTWWALWGILMLILGAALIVVVLLIFRA